MTVWKGGFSEFFRNLSKSCPFTCLVDNGYSFLGNALERGLDGFNGSDGWKEGWGNEA